jgi:hypothetical protein
MRSQVLLDDVGLDSATSIDLEAVIYCPHPNTFGVSSGTAGFASYRPAAAASNFAGRIGECSHEIAPFLPSALNWAVTCWCRVPVLHGPAARG